MKKFALKCIIYLLVCVVYGVNSTGDTSTTPVVDDTSTFSTIQPSTTSATLAPNTRTISTSSTGGDTSTTPVVDDTSTFSTIQPSTTSATLSPNTTTISTSSTGGETSTTPVVDDTSTFSTIQPSTTSATLSPNTTTISTSSTGGETSTTPVVNDTSTFSTIQPSTTSATLSPNTTTISTSSTGGDTSTTPVFNQTSIISTAQPNSTLTPSTATSSPGFCGSNPCPLDSSCVELANNFTCRCLPGSFFSVGVGCVRAKVFPGILHLNMIFSEEMANTNSKIFQETALGITKELKANLKNSPGYVESIVLELRNGSIVATVTNVFELNSDATPTSVKQAIEDAIQNCTECPILKGADFRETNPCEPPGQSCDVISTNCAYNSGIVVCPCKAGFFPSVFSQRSCTACPSGEKAEGEKCVPCPFGYAGFNCNDSSLLAVVVISCLLGGLLLILLIAFLFYYCRTSEKTSSLSSPYTGQENSWQEQNVPKIPRASTHSSWQRPQLEMTENGSTRALVANNRPGSRVLQPTYDVSTDDLRTFKSKSSSKYPYLVQGQDNPYYTADE